MAPLSFFLTRSRSPSPSLSPTPTPPLRAPPTPSPSPSPSPPSGAPASSLPPFPFEATLQQIRAEGRRRAQQQGLVQSSHHQQYQILQDRVLAIQSEMNQLRTENKEMEHKITTREKQLLNYEPFPYSIDPVLGTALAQTYCSTINQVIAQWDTNHTYRQRLMELRHKNEWSVRDCTWKEQQHTRMKSEMDVEKQRCEDEVHTFNRQIMADVQQAQAQSLQDKQRIEMELTQSTHEKVQHTQMEVEQGQVQLSSLQHELESIHPDFDALLSQLDQHVPTPARARENGVIKTKGRRRIREE